MIYHILEEESWEKALSTGKYAPKAYSNEGFIHASTEAQLIETAKIHFPNKNELLVLSINPYVIKNKLKWEVSRNEEEFPHIYGKLKLEEVNSIKTVVKIKDNYELI